MICKDVDGSGRGLIYGKIHESLVNTCDERGPVGNWCCAHA
jgi:hypothetical protein